MRAAELVLLGIRVAFPSYGKATLLRLHPFASLYLYPTCGFKFIDLPFDSTDNSRYGF
jgi:hypothetical protein